MRATNGTNVLRLLSPAAAFGAALFLAQPAEVLAQPASTGATRIIEGMSEPAAPILNIPAKARAWRTAKPRHSGGFRRHGYVTLARPVLAGIRLVQPLSGPFPQPGPIVPAPAYLFDSFFADLTTPPPPVVCRRSGRHVPLACSYDID
jgi:hypothetical protein